MKNLLSKMFTALFVLSIAFTPSFATNWVRIGDGHYIDSDSIRPSTSYGTYTMATKYLASGTPLEVMNGRDVWTIKTNSFVDCTSNYAKTISYSAYDKRGHVVATGRNIWKQWYDINNPGSRAYESYAFVCTDKYLQVRKDYEPLWWY